MHTADDRPWVIVYLSPHGNKGTFYRATKDLAIDKIADLMLVPHKVRIFQTNDRTYTVTAVPNSF